MTQQSASLLSNKLTLSSIPKDALKNQRILLRVDYNVPLSADGTKVANNQRIVATLPTIKFLQDAGVRSMVLMSHLGRPDGAINSKLSLKPVAGELEDLLGKPVIFLDDCVGERVEEACAAPPQGAIILLENLRFHLEEEGKVTKKDGTKMVAQAEDVTKFRQSLSKLGDVYVNDAFGAAHRAHSSISGIDIPLRVAGLLMSKELTYFGKILDSPDGIDLAILGGAKVSDKIKLINNLLPRVKTLAIGGGMAFTLLRKFHGMDIGKSLFDQAGFDLADSIQSRAKELGVKLILPADFVTGSALSEDSSIGSATLTSGIPPDMMGLDIGPKSTDELVEAIKTAKSILWNGPVGVFEVTHFSHGTEAIVKAMMDATKKGAVTIVGGGDSGAAVAKFGDEASFSHVSTGGGASLELLEGKELPGITSLTSN